MKTLKTLLSVLVLVAVFSVNAFAQVDAHEVEVSATANLLSTLTLKFDGAGDSDEINFGDLVIADYTAIVKSDGSAHALTGESASPATGKLSATTGNTVYISYSTTATMSNGAGETLTITPSLHVDGQAIAAAGGTYTLTDDEVDVVVGASVDIEESTAAGVYSTDLAGGSAITITFNFN